MQGSQIRNGQGNPPRLELGKEATRQIEYERAQVVAKEKRFYYGNS